MPEAARHGEAQALGASVWAVVPRAGERPVVLTYDDGPEPGGTEWCCGCSPSTG